MPIFHSLISRGTTVLCEHTDMTGNFSTVAVQILGHLPSRDTKVTYSSDEYLFHIVVDQGIIFMCLCDREFSRRQAFGFLFEIQRKFTSGVTNLRQRAQAANAYELNRDFANVLASEMKRYSSSMPGDQLSALQSQVDEVKDIMTQNIDKVLERGEKIEILVDKTEELSSTADSFQKSSKKLKTQMWWRDKKWTIVIVLVILVVIGIIVLAILGGTGAI